MPTWNFPNSHNNGQPLPPHFERGEVPPTWTNAIIVDRSHGIWEPSGANCSIVENHLGRRLSVFRSPSHPEELVEHWLKTVYDDEYLALAYSIHAAMLEAEKLLASCAPVQALRGSKSKGQAL